MKTKYKLPHILVIIATILCAQSLAAQDDIVLNAIKNEVERNKAELKIENLERPFYIRYMIFETNYLNMTASLGTLQSSTEYKDRFGYPTLLVGSYERNNLNYMAPNLYYRMYSYPRAVSLENDPKGIATAIWADLDKAYKDGAEVFAAKQAIIKQQNLQDDELNLVDFEKVAPVNIREKRPAMNSDRAYWENYVKTASALLLKYPEINFSSVHLSVRDRMVYYYDTDNSNYMVPEPYYMLNLNLSTMTDDGQELNDIIYFEHPSFEQMPDLATFTKECEDFIKDFIKLKNAPLVNEAYSGPVLLEKMALAENFQHHFFQTSPLIAKRKPITTEDMRYYNNNASKGNDLEMMTNKKVTSRSLTIKSLSGTPTYKGKKLDGYYLVDAEGVRPSEELVLVENGVLRNMLIGRSPSLKNKHTNGHKRFNWNSRQASVMPGNVHLTSNDTYTNEELKQKLFAAAKEEDLEYAYIIRRMRGNSPLVVYRVYLADGREELVRGVSLPDLNLKSYKRVLGASKEEFTYNTNSFGALVTYILPEALLLEEVDVTRDNNLTLKTPYVVPKPEFTIK